MDAMLEQMMRDPEMARMMMQNPEMARMMPGSPNKPFVDPFLTNMITPVSEQKDIGAAKFKARDTVAALAAYQSAVNAAGLTNGGGLAWPQVETLVFACRSNAALCLIQLGRPDEGIVECDTALAMPIANKSELLPKVLARKLQALVDANRARAVILSFADELRRRGAFDHGGMHGPGQQKLLEQIARLDTNAESESVTQRAFDVLTAHWLANSVIRDSELDAATDRIALVPEAEHDGAVLRELSALAAPLRLRPGEPPPGHRVSLKDAIGVLFGCFSDANNATPPAEQGVNFLRWVLNRGGMHPSFPGAIDPHGGAFLVWGIAVGFERSMTTEADLRNFRAYLDVLVDAGADVNQREREGHRLPLMHVARSGCPGAVQAMLAKGASVHLRDEEGWTPLLCCCMNDVTNPTAPERVACLQALLNAGADANAQTLMGGTALLCAATHSEPHYELMDALLAVGADATLRGKAGDSVTTHLQSLLDQPGQTAAMRESIERMLAKIQAAGGPQAQLEAKTAKFQGFMNTVLRSAFNEGIDEDQLARQKVLVRGVQERMASGTLTDNDKENFRGRYAQELRVLTALMRSVGLDVSLLTRRTLSSDGNWLAELHRLTMALIPDPFLKMYCDTEPTEDEIMLFSVLADAEDRKKAMVDTQYTRTWDQNLLRRLVMHPFRHRGELSKTCASDMHKMIFEPVQHAIGYAVPNDAALEVLAAHAPLVEVGAGTGYWAAVLQQRGVDILAYDAEPPSADMSNNFFYDFAFTDVLKGAGATIFGQQPELAKRALVLVWPNNADAMDNPEFAEVGHPVWDADCLEQYIAAGGTTVIYVGERESQIAVVAGACSDSGITGSRRFQAMLAKYFTLVQEVAIPRWVTAADDLTVWSRKSEPAPIA